MSGTHRRQGRSSASTRANTVNNNNNNNIPNTRSMGNAKLRDFIQRMDTPDSFRQALEDHLGIPSIRTRFYPPQPHLIAERVGNVAQRRRDMVPIGIRYDLALSLYIYLTSEKRS